MGSGINEFTKTIGGYLAKLLILGLVALLVIVLYNNYKSKQQTRAEIAQDTITIREMSKDVKKVESKILKDTKKKQVVQYTSIIGPHEVEIVDVGGRKRAIMTVNQEEHSFTVNVPKECVKQPIYVGLYRNYYADYIGITSGLLPRIPWLFDMQLETGLMVGKTHDYDYITGAWTVLLSKEIALNFSVGIGAGYDVSHGGNLIYGVRYEF